MFSAKFYSLRLLLKSVNRNIRSCSPESIAYWAEFWKAAFRSISSMVVMREESTSVGSAGVPVTEVWAGCFPPQQQALTCALMSNAVTPVPTNCTQQVPDCCLSVPKTCLAQMGWPWWCFPVLKALQGFQRAKNRAVSCPHSIFRSSL